MKNYLSTRKVSSRPTFLRKQLVTTFGFLIAICILWYAVPTFVSAVVAVVMWPIESVRVWVNESSSSLPVYLRERSILDQTIKDLEAKVAMCGGGDNTIAKLEAENQQFRLLCDAVPDERIVARVVARPPYLPYDLLMLDRGENDGVVLDAPVFLGSDQVIGYVSHLTNETAFVTLVTTSDFVATAYIIGPNIYTYAEGMGGGMLRVSVPQGITLRTGDTVILPALDSGVYGVITDIETSPTQPAQYGYVPLSLSLQSIQYVSISTKPIVTQTYDETKALIDNIRSDLFTVDLPDGVLVSPETLTTSSSLPIATSTYTPTTTTNP